MQLFRNFRKPNPTKSRDDDNVMGFALHADGHVVAIKQGSGMYGAGFGSNAFSETAFGTQIALSQSTFGWSAAYSVSTWVYRCIEVRKNAINGMPWAVYSKRTQKPLPKHPLTIAIKRNKQKFFKKLEQSFLLYGEVFIEKGVNPYGFTSDLYWLNNNGMTVLQGAGRIMGYAYTAMQGGEPQTFEVDEIAFMKTDNPFNDLRGMSPTEVIMDEVAIDKDVARVVRAYYANDTRVGVIFIPKTNLNPGDAEAFLEYFKKDNQGPNRAGKPVLMPQDMTVERIQEPATLDDVQLRESTRREIAAAYGVPLSLAGGWDDAKYQSLPEQRQSFYEETVIPQCDNIAEFINADLLPYFDDSGNFYFGFDYTSVLALAEDAQKKNDIYTARLAGGVITRAEARKALGHPTRPSDEVYYIPVGATIIPADQEILVTPEKNEVTSTTQEQQQISDPANEQPASAADQSAPAQPKRLPEPPQPKSIQAPQQTPLDELNAWEKKALNNNAIKAIGFTCYVVPKDLQLQVRGELGIAGKSADKATIKAIFAKARVTITPPPHVLDYWKDYDALMAELGHGWMTDYMSKAFAHLAPKIDGAVDVSTVQTALDTYHNEFANNWLGTDAEPGPLVKLIQAGMAAGQQAIIHGSAANPNRPMLGKAVEVDWNLMAHEARDFASQYLYNLIRNIDDTTRKAVQDAVAKWIESGEPLDKLKDALQVVFNDEARAQLIAQTESTRAYAEGSQERYRRADVKYVKWNTVKTADVCPICDALGKEAPAPISEGFKAASGNAFPPNHPGCRCWLRPVVEE